MLSKMKDSLEQVLAQEDILAAACSGCWDRILIQAETHGQKIDRDTAKLCLEQALQNATAEIFDRLLALLPGREYTGSVVLMNAQKGYDADVNGTLVTLAAAMGKAEHLKCLLARGWDVNSASLDAARELKLSANVGAPYFQMLADQTEPYAACPESHLLLLLRWDDDSTRKYMNHFFLGVTPLAAAVLCGQVDCVRVLLSHGAWKEEAPSVARALMQPDRAGKEYQMCRKAVLTYGKAPRPMALWAVVRSADEAQLEQEMNRWRYSEDAITKAIWELCDEYRVAPSRGYWDEEQERDFRRLRILARHYPRVVCRPELVSLLLRWGMMHDCNEEIQEFLLKLCPERVDLSLIREGLVRMPPRRASTFLRKVCEGRVCIMDRDSVPPVTSVLVLGTLLQCVKFLPPTSDRSISGLSYAILRSGNIRLIRKALESGIIPAEEPTDLLLRCLGDASSATATRALLLTTPRLAGDGQRTEHRKRLHNGPMFRWMPPELRERGYEELLEDECPPELERELVLRGIYDYLPRLKYEAAEGTWEMDSPLSLLCLTGRHRVVERWVRCAPEAVLEKASTIQLPGADYKLRTTPLCTAAFAGQRAVVETLLTQGAEVNEQDHGMPSMLLLDNGADVLPITPLLAAVVQGHWDIARLLLRHGAVCDFEQFAAKCLWSFFQRKSIEEMWRHLDEETAKTRGRFLTAR